jgi:hypothetical protein
MEMKCPACGAEGRAPKDKINTRLVCRRCLKVFHLTASGRAVLGEPPSPAAALAPTPLELQAADRTQKVDRLLEEISQTTIPTKKLLIALGMLLLAGAVTYLWTSTGETLEARVTKVAQAAVQGDLQTIRNLSASGTSDHAVKWYDLIRDRCDDLRQHLGTYKLNVEVSVIQQDDEHGTAEVVSRMNSEEDLQRKGIALPDSSLSIGSPATRVITVPMAFKTEGWSGWLLDGKRTLEETPSSP